MTEEMELFDVSSGKTYCMSLKPEDAQRAYNDPDLLSEILEVLTSKDYEGKAGNEETSGNESPGNSTSSCEISANAIKIEKNATGIEHCGVKTTGTTDEIKIEPDAQFTEAVSDNPTVESVIGSWCQEGVVGDLCEIKNKSKPNAFRWTDDPVYTLIALIDENSDLVVANKKMNREFWELIAHKMSEKGFLLNKIQCVSKWRKMMSLYKNALSVGKPSCSLASSNSFPYFQAMDDLCKTNGWALELFDLETPTNKDDPEQSLSSKLNFTGVVTFECLIKFFDSYKANNDVISGRLTEQKYSELQSYLQASGWKWAVRTSSKAPKDWYIFSYEKGDLKIPYFGHPFVLKKNILLECVHGDLYYGLASQRKENVLKTKYDEPGCLASGEPKEEEPPRKRRALKPTKKLSCPAFMKAVLVYYFPDYKIDCSEPLTWRSKGRVIQELKRDIDLEKSIDVVAQYYLKMSLPNLHSHEISRPRAIVTPMAPTPMKAYVETGLTNMKESGINKRNAKLEEVREITSKIVGLVNSPVKCGTSAKDLQVVLDKLREQYRSMESLFDRIDEI